MYNCSNITKLTFSFEFPSFSPWRVALSASRASHANSTAENECEHRAIPQVFEHFST